MCLSGDLPLTEKYKVYESGCYEDHSFSLLIAHLCSMFSFNQKDLYSRLQDNKNELKRGLQVPMYYILYLSLHSWYTAKEESKYLYFTIQQPQLQMLEKERLHKLQREAELHDERKFLQHVQMELNEKRSGVDHYIDLPTGRYCCIF